jgi:hypothetical protein
MVHGGVTIVARMQTADSANQPLRGDFDTRSTT